MAIEKPMLLDLPMPIRTPRLLITPVHPEHAEAFYNAKVESMEVLYPWMVWAKNGPGTLDEQKEMMTRKYAEFILRENLMMLAFTHDGEFVVATGLHNLDWFIPSAEVGYWCKKSAQGQGYVTEAANAITRYAFEVLSMRKIYIGMDSENTASENVAKRLNMAKEFEELFGVHTLHNDNRRLRLSYACFSVADLPSLDVSWG